MTSDKVKANYAARFACTRASPLICPNQDLVAELAVLQKSRDLEGKSINALSYERAIAVRLAIHVNMTRMNFEFDLSFSQLAKVLKCNIIPLF